MHKFVMTVNEASDYTSVGRNTLRNLIKQNKIPAITVGPKELIIVEDLEKFLYKNRGQDLLDIDALQPVGQQALRV